ncbi:hypothetical protein GRI75_01900 [Altererythrobacter soli]|uniref:Uncharacterized protein n=1 Tax=Croceibacterium soli TaxID=1739690 RepID=A0A6I4UNQ8_9SPHN|nr:copper resistance protein NlpE [Croceibacterium soli]MXP40398.1 hypothetical protein [Croceibacterium soli]
MRSLIVLAAAPLAMLAACADSTPVDEVEPEPMAVDEVPVTIDLPEIPANSLTTIDYPGVYSRDGRTRLRLNADKTYELIRPDGTSVTGAYSELPDGSRIRLEDFDGGPAWFSVGNGAIYRLPSESTPFGEITAEGEYKREPDRPTASVSPSPTASPTASPAAAPTPAEPVEAPAE